MSKSNPKKSARLSDEELAYIRSKILISTDVEISKALSRSVQTVVRARKKMGIIKSQGGRISEVVGEKADSEKFGNVLPDYIDLKEDQRKEFYKTQFESTSYYKNLKEQFTEEELNFYVEEYSLVLLQFDNGLLALERRQIDELLKISILGGRILKHIFGLELEIQMIQKEIDEWRAAHPNITTEPDVQERDNSLYNLLQTMNGVAKSIQGDYQKNVELKNKILAELNARRKDRVEQLVNRGTTFLSLVEEFRNRDFKKKQGYHAELVRISKEKKKQSWRQQTKFPDDSKDCILMDEHSELPKAAEVVLIKDMGSKFAEEFNKEQGKHILIVENDHRRQQFFAEIFKGNTVDFAQDSSRAIGYVIGGEYDLIAMDYDLSLKEKGTDFLAYMLANGKNTKAKILIHSMNKKGATAMEELLEGIHETEVVPFETLIRTFIKDKKEGNENA